jgi:PleD family two-component response regulator
LRLVAANLARVTGGGQAYRCGGEEFNNLFPGKTSAEAIEHLERLRRMIESSEFHLRAGDRRQNPRGPERRSGRARARSRKGDAIRQLSQDKISPALSVTVSMGVATAARANSDPELVLKAADKALYRAKENGRNRVETAAPVRRGRIKAAGIA